MLNLRRHSEQYSSACQSRDKLYYFLQQWRVSCRHYLNFLQIRHTFMKHMKASRPLNLLNSNIFSSQKLWRMCIFSTFCQNWKKWVSDQLSFFSQLAGMNFLKFSLGICASDFHDCVVSSCLLVHVSYWSWLINPLPFFMMSKISYFSCFMKVN